MKWLKEKLLKWIFGIGNIGIHGMIVKEGRLIVVLKMRTSTGVSAEQLDSIKKNINDVFSEDTKTLILEGDIEMRLYQIL